MTDDDAPARDAAEALTPGLRDRFHIPTAPDGSPAIYLAGQSLGLQPRTADQIEGMQLLQHLAGQRARQTQTAAVDGSTHQ